MGLRIIVHHIVHEVAANEAAAASDDDVLGLEFFHVIPHSQ